MNLKKTAYRFLELGLNPVPVAEGSKVPIRKEHQSEILKDEIEDFNWPEIGVSTGYASGNLEVLDFDLKNTDDPQGFLKDFGDMVGRELLGKLVAQKTPSGGYHLIYRCDIIESSQKLAKNEEGHAILETRGIGGYIKCAPSKGYELVKGSLSEIPFITSEERFNLFIAGRKLNKLIRKDSEKRIPESEREFETKFPDYDDDPEIGLNLLYEHGWTEHSRIGDWVNLTRPGKHIKDGMSGGYNLKDNFLYVFSTSQDVFTTERPYANHAIFAELECDGNYKVAYGKLFEEGHGVEDDEDDENYRIDFLSDEVEENTYLEQARKGEVEHGLVTGWRGIDDYFRLKRNSINLGIGFDNVGKSTFTVSLMTASNVMHGWKWGIVAPENKNAETRQTFIETISGQPLQALKDSDGDYYKYRDYTRNNFFLVANKKHYTIADVISMGKRMYEYKGIDALLIDPYNFFSGTSNYGEDGDILSKLRVFADNYCSVYIMAHPYTEATRSLKDKDGYLTAPNKYAIQGGANFAYRVDDVFVIHRIVNHPSAEIKKTTQFIVDKIKTVRTGGQVHPLGEYSELVWEVRDDFLGYWDVYGNNPIYSAMLSKLGVDKIRRGGLGKRKNLNLL